MLLDPKDRKLKTNVNTHLGLFSYKHLPFEIVLALTIFQSQMEKILQGISKAVCYSDNVLITSKDDLCRSPVNFRESV